jgi:hypothetical protein
MVELATFLEPAWRGRSESASESSVGGWAWGAKTFSTESVVELASGEPCRREPAGFSRSGQYLYGPLLASRPRRLALSFVGEVVQGNWVRHPLGAERGQKEDFG